MEAGDKAVRICTIVLKAYVVAVVIVCQVLLIEPVETEAPVAKEAMAATVCSKVTVPT